MTRGWWATAVSLGLAGSVGLATARIAPRGPVTAVGAIGVMATTFATGFVAGRVTQTRWMLVPVALMYLVCFELGRWSASGPTVDGLRLDNAFGILAFVVSRGLHGLLALLPMAFGVGVGRWLARRADGVGSARPPAGSTVLGLATIGLAVVVLVPASTPPILGPDGRPIPGSIAELATVRVDGADLSVLIRAADPDAPVLLYLAGGPGQSDLALARAQVSGWEQEFVIADLDQRGTGRSYAAIEPTDGLTLERAVDDVIAVTDDLRERFDEDRIYLMGESWGTLLGVLAVQARPDLYHAWIGSGQMVNVTETDRLIYDDLQSYASRVGDTALATKLAAMGEPPYRDIPWSNANMLAWYDHLYASYTPSDGYLARGAASGLDPFGVLGSEYGLMDKANVLRGLIDTFTVLYPQIQGIDLRERAPRLEVPVYVLDGAAELRARRALALDWFTGLEAPIKRLVTFDGAAHAVAFEQADAVERLLIDEIVPATYGR
jgi:pimeloyl-ACP methyl ester carboxylesterase